jgi:hypothetical protein
MAKNSIKTAPKPIAAKTKAEAQRESHTAQPLRKAEKADETNETELKPVEGETIVQHKATLDDTLAGDRSMENIGKGSATELAPAVRGQTESTDSERIVQQGDDVVIFTKNPVNGQLENRGKVLKVNQDRTLAIRVPLSNGQTQDFTGVGNVETQDTNPYWAWPSGE